MDRENIFQRSTKETQIQGKLNLDGKASRTIRTGIGFLDHMLDLWAFHGGFDLELSCTGDIEVCPHHTIEDIAICLGQAFTKALGDRKGIQRYGCCLMPMDETLSRTVVDISGRAFHVYNVNLLTQSIGGFPTEMVQHFFYSFTINAGCTLHQEILYGNNDHHKVESLFKGLGRSLKQSVFIIGGDIPSTKGVL